MATDITNRDDMIDLRDVIARFEELEGEREGLVDNLNEAMEAREAFDHDEGGGDEAEIQQNEHHAKEAVSTWDADNGPEVEMLQSLLNDLKGYGGDEQWRGDWYPIGLIRDTYFVDAMQELCEDIGDVPVKGFPSYMVIDWEATAKNLRADYSSVEFDGVTYWYR